MIDPPPERITWCYREWKEAYATMDLVDVRFEEGLPSASMLDSTTRNLIVIDDLMAETDERVTTLYTKKSHHRNTSVLYLVQNLFPKNKESRTISLNSQYMVVFKNPRDASQMSHLARQMYPGAARRSLSWTPFARRRSRMEHSMPTPPSERRQKHKTLKSLTSWEDF